MKILIWGTGNLAERLLHKGLKEHNIIGFIETVKSKETFWGYYERNKAIICCA